MQIAREIAELDREQTFSIVRTTVQMLPNPLYYTKPTKATKAAVAEATNYWFTKVPSGKRWIAQRSTWVLSKR